MDPVSVVGVAAAAVQFLDATVKAYNIFREIHGSQKSNTERNEQLEENVRAARNLRVDLTPPPASQGAGDPASQLTAKCISKANELLKLLEYVRGIGETINSLRAFTRAVKKKKHIEQLYASLKEDQDTLNQIIHHKLLPSIDHLTVLQTKEFASLNSTAQALIRELVEQRRIQADNAAALAGKLDNVHGDMQRCFNKAKRSKAHEELLTSLWFPEIDQRYNEIKEPAPMTLNWLFEAPMKHNRAGEWSDFTQWLREDSSMYWISGKAGSGKSTLMAHVVHDERTCRNLRVWGDGYTLEIFSFFFWRAGSELQRSISGLLRSLLYQLCRSRPTVADAVLDHLSRPSMIPTWTGRSLRDHISKAIQCAKDYRFCIFIDGLDEYKHERDTLDDLVNDLYRLQDLGLGNVKLCVSSRPELELVHRFQGLKQLRLQDLNQGDIQNFVRQSFEKSSLGTDDRSYFTCEVTWRADGVFLWAALVARDLVRGSKALDDRTTMERRLDSLPRNMDQLYKRMLSDVDRVYRRSLALYVQLMTIHAECEIREVISIPTITMLQSSRPIISYAEFANECERTEAQIASGSAGILEVISLPWLARISEDNWKTSRTKYLSDHPCFTLEPTKPSRRRGAENEPYPAMLKYEHRIMRWIHRSAFEFFSDSHRRALLPPESNISHEVLLRRISEAQVGYLETAPSYVKVIGGDDGHMLITERRISTALEFASWRGRGNPEVLLPSLDTLSALCAQLNPFELSHEFPGPENGFTDGDTLRAMETIFWVYCADESLLPYMSSRMGRVLSVVCDDVAAYLLYRYVVFTSQSTYRHYYHDFNSIAESLLQRMVQRFGVGDVLQTAKRKPDIVHPAIDSVMKRRTVSNYYNFPVAFSCLGGPPSNLFMTYTAKAILALLTSEWGTKEGQQVPASLFALMELLDMHIGPGRRDAEDDILISPKGWKELSDRWAGSPVGIIGSHISATQAGRTVGILCAQRPGDHGQIYHTPQHDSQRLVLHPSVIASDRLLGLLGYKKQQAWLEFGIVPDSQQQREELCELLLREIQSPEQGWGEDEKLLASKCVRDYLLDPAIESRPAKWLVDLRAQSSSNCKTETC